jgi:hypothetical protein
LAASCRSSAITQLGDQLYFFLGRAADLTPGLGQQFVKLGVLEVLQLANQVSGDIGRRDLLGLDGLEQLQRVGGPRGERRQRGALFLWRERGISGEHRAWHFRVVVQSQAREHRLAQVAVADQTQQNGQQLRIFHAEQCFERLAARNGVALGRVDEGSQGRHGRRIAEGGPEGRRLAADLFVVALEGFRVRDGPVLRRRDLPLAFQRFANARDDFAVFLGVVFIDDSLHERGQRLGRPAASDSLDHELAKHGNRLAAG